ncbi:erythromycin esterase family protein [Candidatus Acetothermia bacterium]|nr:erythromycin esterase family protein [Candidatus Acetothermia bacterium]
MLRPYRYRSISLIFGSLTVHQVIAPPAESYEEYFHSAQISRMFVDLRGIQAGSTETDWILGPRLFRSIGAVYRDDSPRAYYYNASLPEEFDVVIYFDDTSPSILLGRR